MKKMNVLSNGIGTEGGKALVDAAPPQLQTFCGFDEGQAEADLSRKSLGAGDAILLAWELTTGYVSASLTSADLSRNNFGNDGAVAVAKALEVNASLTSMDLSYCNLGNDGAVELAKALHVNASMKSLK